MSWDIVLSFFQVSKSVSLKATESVEVVNHSAHASSGGSSIDMWLKLTITLAAESRSNEWSVLSPWLVLLRPAKVLAAPLLC